LAKWLRLCITSVLAVSALLAAGPVVSIDLTLGSGAVQGCEAGPIPTATIAAIGYTEPTPVFLLSNYGAGRYDPSVENNLGIGRAYGELNALVGRFCVGALYRADYYGEASRDLLDALVQTHTGTGYTVGRRYRLTLSNDGFEADGLRVRRAFDLAVTERWSLRWGLGLSLLRGKDVNRQTAVGEATATSTEYAVGTATWLRTRSNLNLANFNPFVASGTPTGRGFSTDVELKARSVNGWEIDATVMDARGRIYWQDVPQSLRSANDATIHYNENLDRDALIHGVDSRISVVQDIAPTYRAAITVPLTNRLRWLLEDDLVRSFHFPSGGVRYVNGQFESQAEFDVRTRSVGLSIKQNWLRLGVTANRWQPSHASTLGLYLGVVRTAPRDVPLQPGR
jgi:hypothetical protein